MGSSFIHVLIFTANAWILGEGAGFPIQRINYCPSPIDSCIPLPSCPYALDQFNVGRYVDICGWDFDVPLVCCPNYIAEGGYAISAGGDYGFSAGGDYGFSAGGGYGFSAEGGYGYSAVGLAETTDPTSPLNCGVKTSQIFPLITSYGYASYAPGVPLNAVPLVGGVTATQTWPWIAAIFFGKGPKQICGGTAVDALHIVTAAHCFNGRSLDTARYTVLVGELDIKSAASRYGVADIKIHENFRFDSYYDDIAIIRLTRTVSRKVPACLPEEDGLIEGDNCTILGWGKLTAGGWNPRELQELHDLSVVRIEICNDRLGEYFNSYYPRGLTENMICAGGSREGGRDACEDDSGGPLLRFTQGLWTLVGVVSFGVACGEPGIPGVYTKVSAYFPWIMEYLTEVQNEVDFSGNPRNFLK